MKLLTSSGKQRPRNSGRDQRLWIAQAIRVCCGTVNSLGSTEGSLRRSSCGGVSILPSFADEFPGVDAERSREEWVEESQPGKTSEANPRRLACTPAVVPRHVRSVCSLVARGARGGPTFEADCHVSVERYTSKWRRPYPLRRMDVGLGAFTARLIRIWESGLSA